MRKQDNSWLKQIFHWLLRLLFHTVKKPKQIFQAIFGNRNQTIAVMTGGTAISNVDKLIQHFHLSPQEIISLEDFWKNWSMETKPIFSHHLVIGGREQMRDRIVIWLRGDPSSFALQSDSQEETIAFLASVVQGLAAEECQKIFSRAVVVNNSTSWQSVITSPNPLILIARLKQPEGIGRAIQQGHHVFIPSGVVSSENENLLPRIVRDVAKQALQEMGLSHDEAGSFATLARRSLSALRRRLAITKNIQQPVWATSNKARILLAPLLVSAWNDTCEGDRNALSILSGLNYETLQNHLVSLVNEPDSPIRRVGDIWMIASQEDAWRLIARYLTDDDLKRFEDIVLNVLSELDPSFELPPEQRYASAIYGKVLIYSTYLRNGISEMLALMSTLSSEISFIMANRTGEEVARRIIWQLMQKVKDSETLWASLAHQLPLLAEAAPEILLEEIATGLDGEKPILINLFQDKTSYAVFMISSPHIGLLWTLETLAWNPDYLSLAALNLARLTRLDPGGCLVNRPAKSLRDIFICWHPNTSTSLLSCLKVLDTIRKHEPDISWSLLMSLLPRLDSTVSPTYKPKYRDWTTEPITEQEYVEITNAILERLISDADMNIIRWCNLVTSARGMYINQQKILLNSLEAINPQQFSSEERVQMSDCLRRETIDYREYSDALWTIPLEHVQRLEAILEHFKPDDLIDKHRWLFNYCVKLVGIRDASWQENEKDIEDTRIAALQEIIISQGWNGVIQLAQQVKEASLVGITLAKAQLLPIDLGRFLQDNFWSNTPWRNALAKGYVSFNAYNHGKSWIEECLNVNSHNWSSEEFGEFLLCIPFNVYLLERLEDTSTKTQHYFWEHVQRIDWLGIDHANHIFQKLLEFGRSHLAITHIHRDLKETPELFPPEQIAKVLEICVREEPSQNFDVHSFAFRSAELMNYLENTNLSREQLADLELMYFRIHENYRRPRLLFDKLEKNPELFVEALQYIFRAENELISKSKESDETEKTNRSVAELALHLLDKWKQMPGVLEDGSVDGEALRDWVIKVRELSSKCGRGKVADIYIGHSLAFSPVDPDGAWPARSVRNLIEELANSTIESGLKSQVFNNRGITTRFPIDGGEQERFLVEKYEKYIRQIRDQWPRTAAVLRKIAENYRQQAFREDVQSELTQDFW